MIGRGDEERLALVEEGIKKRNLAGDVLNHEAWTCVMEAVAAEEKRWHEEMYVPEKLEFKAGVLYGLKIVREFADRVKKELNFLTNQKQELLNSQLKGSKV